MRRRSRQAGRTNRLPSQSQRLGPPLARNSNGASSRKFDQIVSRNPIALWIVLSRVVAAVIIPPLHRKTANPIFLISMPVGSPFCIHAASRLDTKHASMSSVLLCFTAMHSSIPPLLPK